MSEADDLLQQIYGHPLIWTWPAIARYVGRPVRTLQRAARDRGFPAARWGRRVVASPIGIAQWLVLREKERRQRLAEPRQRAQRPSGSMIARRGDRKSGGRYPTAR